MTMKTCYHDNSSQVNVFTIWSYAVLAVNGWIDGTKPQTGCLDTGATY